METTETEFIFRERSSKRQTFDKRLIEHIVGLADQGVPRRDLILEYGMAKSTLMEWISRYGSLVRSRKVFTKTEKRSVVRAVEAGMSFKQAGITYGILNPITIKRWIKDFNQENAEISLIKPLEVAKKLTNPSPSAELKALQKALDEANLKIRALDTMIDIAEEQLKIDIRKKSGARQSSK